MLSLVVILVVITGIVVLVLGVERVLGKVDADDVGAVLLKGLDRFSRSDFLGLGESDVEDDSVNDFGKDEGVIADTHWRGVDEDVIVFLFEALDERGDFLTLSEDGWVNDIEAWGDHIDAGLSVLDDVFFLAGTADVIDKAFFHFDSESSMEGWFSDVEVNEDDFLAIDDSAIRKVSDRCGLKVLGLVRSNENSLIWFLWVGVIDIGKEGVVWLKFSDGVANELTRSSSVALLVSLVEGFVLIELTDDGDIWEVVFDITLGRKLIGHYFNYESGDNACDRTSGE